MPEGDRACPTPYINALRTSGWCIVWYWAGRRPPPVVIELWDQAGHVLSGAVFGSGACDVRADLRDAKNSMFAEADNVPWVSDGSLTAGIARTPCRHHMS